MKNNRRARRRFAEERGTVLENGVDLPALAVGRGLHPELVLLGVTTRRTALVCRHDTHLGEATLLGVDVVGRRVLYPEVIQAAAASRVLQQHQLERWVADQEIGIAGSGLGGL